MKKQISSKTISLIFGILVICFAIVFYAFGWAEPQQAPPGCTSGQPGCDAPINVGATGQVKEGALGVYGVFRAVGGADPAIEPGLVVNNGNVGIGTTEPQAKLHVAGTAGTDGIMFPDGTLQTTAGVRTYVSECKSITPQGNVTFNHDLGTDKLIVTIQVKVGGVIHQQHHADYGGWGLGVEAYEISTTQIKVSAGNYIRFFTSTGQTSNTSSADIRVLVIKMD